MTRNVDPMPNPAPSESPQTVLVVLKPSRGRAATAESATAERVSELAPSPMAAERLAEFFTEAGYEVGPLVGISFSLTVPADDVASLLGDEIDGEYAHPSIPASLRRHIDTIVRERPIDFGPVSF